MRIKLFLLAITFFPYFGSGQIIHGEQKIDASKVKPWIPQQNMDFQSVYHFGLSELESSFVLIISKDSCYAQIQSGKFTKDAKDFIWNFKNLKNVRIEGNKFFSDLTNGEFAIYKDRKGLIVYKPWRSVAKKGEYEIGFVSTSLEKHCDGKFSFTSFRILTINDLEKMTLSELQIMRNEIYARYGYIFKQSGDMDNYFKTQSWYRGQHQDISNFLTGLEKQNIILIQTIEKIKGANKISG
jgi:hypothetical protein